MQKFVLAGLLMTLASCSPGKGGVASPFGKEDLLLFLNSDDWVLHQICQNGNCETASDNETYPFGIDTNNAVANYCSDEQGEFYTIGKYNRTFDPETYEIKTALHSDPDYFKISETGYNRSNIKIMLCTPYGYYSGVLKIIDASTIQIIAKRPEYENKEVAQIYKRASK